MTLLTKKEFADRCGMDTKSLAVYKINGRIVYSGEKSDRVNISVEPNKSFLEKYSRKMESKIQASGKTHNNKLIVINGDKQPTTPEPPLSDNLETKKLSKQIEKMEKEIEKLSLNNQKAMGQVIPVSIVDSIILQERQSILTESKNTLQDILTIFAKRRDLNASERADISASFTDSLNEMMRRASEATTRSIESIVKEFSVKRGKGERT